MFNQFGTNYQPYNQYNPMNNFTNVNAQQLLHPIQQNLIRVTGLDGAKAYQMQPNSVVALFDANEDVFYVKSTDGAGFPTIRAFRFTPYNVEENQTEYVARSEFNELKEMLLNGKQFVPTESTKSTQNN